MPRLQLTSEGPGLLPEGLPAGKLVVLLWEQEEQINIKSRCQVKNAHEIAPVLYAARALRPIFTSLVSWKCNSLLSVQIQVLQFLWAVIMWGKLCWTESFDCKFIIYRQDTWGEKQKLVSEDFSAPLLPTDSSASRRLPHVNYGLFPTCPSFSWTPNTH